MKIDRCHCRSSNPCIRPMSLRFGWIASLVLLGSSAALGCSNPALHPEMAEFNTLVETLGAQPPGPVQLRFKIGSDARVGQPLGVRLSFWAKQPFESGHFVITPSPGVELVGTSGRGDIPYRGMIDLVVRPNRNGYHYLKVETLVQSAGMEIRRIEAIALPVGSGHPDARPDAQPDAQQDAQQDGEPARIGFAGSRLSAAIRANRASDTGFEPRSPTPPGASLPVEAQIRSAPPSAAPLMPSGID